MIEMDKYHSIDGTSKPIKFPKSNGADLEISSHYKCKAMHDENLLHPPVPQIHDCACYRAISNAIQSIPFQLSRHACCARIIIELMMHPHRFVKFHFYHCFGWDLIT